MAKNDVRRAAGCVVWRRGEAGAPELLLIHDQYGRWTIPKGHLEAGESEAEAAEREVWEETGVRGELGALVERIEYQVMSKKGQPRQKQVAFFLLRANAGEVVPQAEEGIAAAEWCAPANALARAGYPQVREVLARALELLG